MPRSGRFWLIFGLILAAGGCGPAIFTSLQQEAGPPVSFAALAARPDTYKGRMEILGGEVMSVTPWGNGSLLTVDQRQLDERLFPIGATSGGTFMVETDEWLNSAVYVPKSRVVVAGVVEGEKDGRLLLKARQITFLAPPSWEKWYYPVPREWYPPGMEYWFTPPYFDPYRGGGRS
jgi:starvation-inducible outer membrane lipoprotein